MALDLVTTGDLAKALGVTPQRVDQIVGAADDFPEPTAVLSDGTRLWKKRVAMRWFEEHPRRRYTRRSEDGGQGGA